MGVGFSGPALPELIPELPLELPTEADSCGFLQPAEGLGCAAGAGLEAPVLKVLTAQGSPSIQSASPHAGAGRIPDSKFFDSFSAGIRDGRRAKRFGPGCTSVSQEASCARNLKMPHQGKPAEICIHRRRAVPVWCPPCQVSAPCRRQPFWPEPCKSFCTPFRVLLVSCHPCTYEIRSNLQTFRLITHELLRVAIVHVPIATRQSSCAIKYPCSDVRRL